MNSVPDYFGSLVFDDRAMKAKLPFGVYDSLRKTIDEGANLNTDVANAVADAMKRSTARTPGSTAPGHGALTRSKWRSAVCPTMWAGGPGPLKAAGPWPKFVPACCREFSKTN